MTAEAMADILDFSSAAFGSVFGDRPQAGSGSTWSTALQTDAHGKAKPVLRNLVALLTLHPALKDSMRLNTFSGKVEITKKIPWRDVGEFGETDATELALWCSKEVNTDFDTSKALEATLTIAARNSYNPLQDWIKGLYWSGERRIDTWLIDVFGVPDTPYYRSIGRKFLIALAARALIPGCKADTMLILEGEQGIGKSKAVEALAGAGWFATQLESPMNKDFMQNLRGNWIVEIAEMQSFNRAEDKAIKAIISNHVDNYRKSYGRSNERYPRACLFVGTTNDYQYLNDATGARRMWPVRCVKADIDYLKKYRSQLIAEAAAAFQAGEDWWTVEGEKEEQQERYMSDVWEEFVSVWLEGKAPLNHYPDFWNPKEIQMRDVLTHALSIERSKQGRAEQIRAGKVLSVLGWDRVRVRVENKLQWIYRPKP